jgi:hypothetical protein
MLMAILFSNSSPVKAALVNCTLIGIKNLGPALLGKRILDRFQGRWAHRGMSLNDRRLDCRLTALPVKYAVRQSDDGKHLSEIFTRVLPIQNIV